jgi:outer membrane protein
MKKILITIITILFVGIGFVNAQKDYVSFNYGISFGTGDLGEFISATSFRGFLFEYRKSVSPNITVGVDAAWNMFYERKDKATYTRETVSVTGTQFRYSRNVPVLISADYFFRSDKPFRPYVNVGLGTMYTRRTVDMGVYRFQDDTWQFALKPEVGLLYEFNDNNGFKFGAKYYYGFEAGGLDAQSYFSLSFGYVYLF